MANPKLIQTRIIILSLTVGLFFCYAAHQYLGSYSAFEMETARLRIARDQIHQAKEQRKRVNQYNKAMATFATFMSQVKLFQLSAEHWQSYDVSVNKSLSFAEAGNILDQLSHAKTYYFMPVHLFLGTGAYRQNPKFDADQDSSEETPLTIAPPVTLTETDESGDVSFTIQGKFMVRDGL